MALHKRRAAEQRTRHGTPALFPATIPSFPLSILRTNCHKQNAHTHTQTQTHVLVHGHPTLGSSEFSLQYLTLTTDAYKHIEYILYRYINNSAMSFPWAYSRVLSQALKKLEDVEQDLQGG